MEEEQPKQPHGVPRGAAPDPSLWQIQILTRPIRGLPYFPAEHQQDYRRPLYENKPWIGIDHYALGLGKVPFCSSSANDGTCVQWPLSGAFRCHIKSS